ncbi:MAG: hypothetical protein KGH63_04590, partial [Candidatus Micrarchaeota archaeon]|nr:hypothetical protein [Candidatus Micrarchaeota archaeon]
MFASLFIYQSSVVVLKKTLIGKPTFKIENIVASANLELDLDLYAIAYKVHDVEYEPE